MTAQDKNVSLIELLVDQFYREAIDEKSDLYLPKLIQGQTNPSYEPYSVEDWKAPQVPAEEEGASQICAAVSEEVELIPSPGSPPVLTFTGVKISGISNVAPDLPEIKGDLVTVHATLSSLGTAPRPLTIAGGFAIEQQCCPSDDGKHCSGSAAGYSGTGIFTLEILSSQVTAAIEIGTAPDEKQLTGTVTAIDFDAATTAGNMAVVVDISSLPEEVRRIWNTQAEKILNSREALAQLLANTQEMMSQQSTRDSLSELITNGLKSLAERD